MENDVNKSQEKSFFEPDEKAYEAILDEWNKPVDTNNTEAVRALQQQGFQAACLFGKDIFSEIDTLILILKGKIVSIQQLNNSWLGNYMDKIMEVTKVIQDRIGIIKSAETLTLKEIKEFEDKKNTIEQEIEAIKTKVSAIRTKMVESKSQLGSKLVNEVEQELEKISGLERKIYDKVKSINDDSYNNTKVVLEKIILKWQAVRANYFERFELLAKKMKSLGSEGINRSTAYILMAMGSATAGVSGYFFAIFSTSANFSSNDAFYYLLKNAIGIAGTPTHPFKEKIAYLIGAITLITLLGWAFDFLLHNNKSFISNKEKQAQGILLNTDFEIEGIRYSYNLESKTWFLLWLKIAPIILIAGMVILVLSRGESIGTETDKLSDSTEGMVIGTALSMGLAGFVYLYITKIVENRQLDEETVRRARKNWELATILLLSLIIIFCFAFYNNLSFFDRPTLFSIMGFIISSLITAFSFAYGLRFMGLIDSLSEIEGKISIIDRAIATYSGARQPFLKVDYNQNMVALMDVLNKKLLRKTELLDNMNSKDKITYLDPDPQANLFDKLWAKFKKGSPKNSYGDAELFEILEWEQEYFPEHAEELRHMASLYNEKKKVEKENIVNIQDKKNELLNVRTEIAKLEQKIERFRLLWMKASKCGLEKNVAIRESQEKQIAYLRDGFDLGLWYMQHEMGPKHGQILLNAKN